MITLLFIWFSINVDNKNLELHSPILEIEFDLPLVPRNEDYDDVIAEATKKREEFKNMYLTLAESEKPKILERAGTYLSDIFISEVFPHWYGTEWDFNGTTNQPQEGQIACGYFVSTTIKHLGWNVNRYKFAQQASYFEAKTINLGKKPTTYNFSNLPELKSRLKSDFKDGLLIVGLDNHVGFIYQKDDEFYFIHSDYVDDRVRFEKLEDSFAFSSSIYVVASITDNPKLIKKWILNEALFIYTN